MKYRKPTVAFDVDGCLLDEKGQPRRDIVDILFKLIPYCQVVVWSGSGLSYAKHAGRQLFLPPEVLYWSKTKIATLDICFDDEEVSLAVVNVKV